MCQGLDKYWIFSCAVLSPQSCPTLCNPRDCSPPGFSVHGDSPGKDTGVGCQALLQGIFPSQGSNPRVLHCKWILHHLSHQGSPLCVCVCMYVYIHTHICTCYSFGVATIKNHENLTVTSLIYEQFCINDILDSVQDDFIPRAQQHHILRQPSPYKEIPHKGQVHILNWFQYIFPEMLS